ncbi:hypothetical protein [Pseudomonas gingeri]|uniref:hypothetical protein n=1 Tax=Pseudomonas gingeri TaxID=117681 RepID=UPI00210E427E|nr:hypothetical protein [Pseudomonas gingeri]
MGKPLNVLLLPFPFVRNPYTPDAYLRLDEFERQFTVVCTGVLSMPQDAPQVGYYRRTDEYVLGHVGLIEDAIARCVSRFYELHAYPNLIAAASFDPRTVEVFYTGPKAYKRNPTVFGCNDCQRVLSGVVTPSEIVWRRPCGTADEVATVENRIVELFEKASEEVCEQAYEQARLSHQKARELKGFLISPRWRAFAIKALDNTGVTCCTH